MGVCFLSHSEQVVVCLSHQVLQGNMYEQAALPQSCGPTERHLFIIYVDDETNDPK